MAKDRFTNLDLNLLRTFMVIAQEQNLRKASASVCHSTAMSHALQRLRHHFDDELFTKTRTGLSPTPYAERLYAQLSPVMDHLARTINHSQTFSPAELDGKIRIALSPQFLATIGSQLFLQIHHAAPNLQVEVINWSKSTMVDIQQGEIAIGLNYDIPATSKELMRKTLKAGEAMVYVRKDHPYSHETIGLKEAANYPFACLIIPDRTEQRSDVERLFAQHQLTANIAFRSTSTHTVLEVVKATDMLFPCIHDLLNQEHDTFRKINVILDSNEQHYDIVAFYPYKNHNDPLTQWLTGLLADLLATSTPPTGQNEAEKEGK
ncbi:transcriptional regulators LysR family [Photobacterium aphoticum]|uniref:Transcriptional regulators LysR family n=1 Tax=Photobacterium aphoticum TaxID=754436 RepID=A0A090R3A2_9GAMM|nr:transcriptional regulators LysR family [Photobacterium aphoticum]